MTNQERYEYFESGKLQRAVEIELLDWAGYWTTAGTDSIEDEALRNKTTAAVRNILTDLARMIRIVSRLVISMDEVKAADPDGVAEETIRNCVVSVMAWRLDWML